MRGFMCVLQWPVTVEAKPSGCAKPVHAIRTSEVPCPNIAPHAPRRCESGHIPPESQAAPASGVPAETHGGDDAVLASREAEPGDDRGSHGEAEPGDDNGGHGGDDA
jgi:hypothetical protein